MNNLLPQKLEALLFALGKPLSRTELAKMLEVSQEVVEEALKQLGAATDRGIVIVDDGSEVELRTAPEAAELVAKLRREELSRDLGRAGAEVMAILLYKGPSSRATIDFIRGVNSSQALRTLSMRGLVRKTEAGRSIIYELTGELLGALGVNDASQAPQFTEVKEHLDTLHKDGEKF